MKRIYTLVSLLLICSSTFAQFDLKAIKASKGPEESKKLSELFEDYYLVSLDSRSLNEYVKNNRKSAKVKLRIDQSLDWQLQIEENEIRSSNYKAVLTTQSGEINDPSTKDCNTYKGYIRDDPKQFVRLFITNDVITGLIVDQQKGDYYIEPLSTFTKGAKDDRYVVYNLASIKETTGFCGNEAINIVTKNLKSSGRLAASTNPCRILEVATEADYEYFERHSAGSNNTILNIMNTVDGVYQNTFNLRIVVVFQHVYTNSNDPYGFGPDLTVLNEFRDHWNANRTNIKRDLAHLFTGKNFTDGRLGFASPSFGVVCANPSESYSYTVDNVNGTNEAYTTTHEIGHNLDAHHPNEVGHPEECSPGRTVMCRGANLSTIVFGPTAQNEINSYLSSNNSCLYEGPPQVQETLLDGIPITPTSVNYVCYLNNYSLFTTIAGLEGIGRASFDWTMLNNSNGASMTSQSNFFSGSTEGSYTIRLNATNACGASYTFYNFTSENCPSYYQYTVYPNPASDYVTIEFENSKEEKDYPEQFDLIEESAYGSGQPVRTLDTRKESTKQIAKNTRQLTINVKDLPRGRYILRVTKEKEQKDKQIDAIRIVLE